MGIASGLRWAFPWLERFYNRMYPSFDERWENYDKATRDSLVEIEEKALRR